MLAGRLGRTDTSITRYDLPLNRKGILIRFSDTAAIDSTLPQISAFALAKHVPLFSSPHRTYRFTISTSEVTLVRCNPPYERVGKPEVAFLSLVVRGMSLDLNILHY